MLDTPVLETTLDNGIRIATEPVPYVQSVAIGLRIDAGARDEPDERAGISHLLEHMLFNRTLWPGHPLGRAIIGRPEVIAALTREELLNHLADHYVPRRLYCVASGNLEHERFVAEVAKQFGDLNGEPPERPLVRPEAN